MTSKPGAPTPFEIRIFGLSWLLFFLVLGGVVVWRAAALLGAASFLGLAWLASLVLAGDALRRRSIGFLLPGLFALCGTAVGVGADPWHVALGCAGIAVAGAATILVLPGAGRKIREVWIDAAEPLGWTISHLILAVVYYLVLTPIGLLLRIVGYDPMRRRLDRAASSYWIERPRTGNATRPFRQF